MKGLFVAAVVHATYDTIVTYASLPLLLFVAFLVAYDGVLYYIYGKLSRFRRVYRTATAGE